VSLAIVTAAYSSVRSSEMFYSSEYTIHCSEVVQKLSYSTVRSSSATMWVTTCRRSSLPQQ